MRVLTAAYLRAALGELQKSCSTAETDKLTSDLQASDKKAIESFKSRFCKWDVGGIETWHGGGQLSGGAVGHMDDGGRGFIHHHLILVPQAALDEVEQRAVVTAHKNTNLQQEQEKKKRSTF